MSTSTATMRKREPKAEGGPLTSTERYRELVAIVRDLKSRHEAEAARLADAEASDNTALQRWEQERIDAIAGDRPVPPRPGESDEYSSQAVRVETLFRAHAKARANFLDHVRAESEHRFKLELPRRVEMARKQAEALQALAEAVAEQDGWMASLRELGYEVDPSRLLQVAPREWLADLLDQFRKRAPEFVGGAKI